MARTRRGSVTGYQCLLFSSIAVAVPGWIFFWNQSLGLGLLEVDGRLPIKLAQQALSGLSFLASAGSIKKWGGSAKGVTPPARASDVGQYYRTSGSAQTKTANMTRNTRKSRLPTKVRPAAPPPAKLSSQKRPASFPRITAPTASPALASVPLRPALTSLPLLDLPTPTPQPSTKPSPPAETKAPLQMRPPFPTTLPPAPQVTLAAPERGSDKAAAATSPQLTFVLSARSADDEGFPRLPCLLASLAHFAGARSIRELIVVVPDHDRKLFRDSLELNGDLLWKRLLERTRHGDAIRRCVDLWQRSKAFPARVLTDSMVLPTKRDLLRAQVPHGERMGNGGRGANYRVQMLTKIGVATHVRTDFYVTFDCDVYAKRPFDYSDLVDQKSRARIQGETQFSQTQHRAGWWEASERALDARGCVARDDRTIGVTPAVLSTRVSLALMDRVVGVWAGKLGEGAWDLQLFRLLTRGFDWTEYTLHYVAACQAGLRHTQFDTKGEFSQAGLYPYSHFSWGSFNQGTFTKEFGHGSVFGVVQSISGVNPADVNNALVKLIVS